MTEAQQNTAHFTLEPHTGFLCSQTNLTATVHWDTTAQVSTVLQSAHGPRIIVDLLFKARSPLANSQWQIHHKDATHTQKTLFFYRRDKIQRGGRRGIVGRRTQWPLPGESHQGNELRNMSSNGTQQTQVNNQNTTQPSTRSLPPKKQQICVQGLIRPPLD